MPPVIHCVRHAQGFHNISVANHAMHDPMLTPLGEEQCKTLAKIFPSMDRVDAVVASPMKRTVYTALYSFAPAIKDKSLKVFALPELQETSDLPCDTGSNVAELEAEFRNQPVDLSYMYTPPAKAWNSKLGKWSATASAVDDRARIAREWLYNRPEKEIVVVTHGGFLHYFTEDWMEKSSNGSGNIPPRRHRHRRRSDAFPPPVVVTLGRVRSQSESRFDTPSSHQHHHHRHHHHHSHDKQKLPSSSSHREHRIHHHPHSHKIPGTGWLNTEYRSYTFGSNPKSGRPVLIETQQSRAHRMGNDKPLSKAETINLQRVEAKQKAEEEKAYQKATGIQAKV
jgi:broad specificity phosphatase PhoE